MPEVRFHVSITRRQHEPFFLMIRSFRQKISAASILSATPVSSRLVKEQRVCHIVALRSRFALLSYHTTIVKMFCSNNLWCMHINEPSSSTIHAPEPFNGLIYTFVVQSCNVVAEFDCQFALHGCPFSHSSKPADLVTFDTFLDEKRLIALQIAQTGGLESGMGSMWAWYWLQAPCKPFLRAPGQNAEWR